MMPEQFARIVAGIKGETKPVVAANWCDACGLEPEGHSTTAGQEFHRLTVALERHRAEDRDRRRAFNEARERLMARLGADRLTDDEMVIVALDRILSLLEPSDA